MIEKFRPKVVEGRDGLGRRTGEGCVCRVRPGAQGRSFFSLVASSFTNSRPLAAPPTTQGSP
ncbi:hypothetical protein E2C01_068924 [Portunus trituberculatus]|uniref:Uncharacterized protein n=1 Tax=Portunus trituberculatus TaxID=210409 RepID=A0A5B7HNQ9_PORTR|nr:hypothetical protein [Portunus trituberculatus]